MRRTLLLIAMPALLIGGGSAALAWSNPPPRITMGVCLDVVPSGGLAGESYGPFRNLADARQYAGTQHRGSHGQLIPVAGAQSFTSCPGSGLQ